MAFPADLVAELFVGGGWRDISGDVYTRDGIGISRGRRDEGARPEPSRLGLTINNGTGDYSSRNPTGQWYGSLGRNTPIRLGVRTVLDTFTRAVAGGWGTADTGQEWSTGLGVGSVSFDDWQVGGGVARRNLCPNPAAGADLTGWITNKTLSRVGVTGFERPDAGQITGDGSGDDYIIPALAAGSAGVQYTGSVALKVDADATVQVYLLFLDAGSGVLSFTGSGAETAPAGAVLRPYVTATAPANTASVAVQATVTASTATLQVTTCLIEEGSDENAYGDGESGDSWAWDGTQYNSTSTELAITGLASHSVDATSAYRLSWLEDVVHRDVDVAVTVSLPFTDVTGAQVEPANIMLRGQSSTEYYMVRVVITTAEAVTIALMQYPSTVLASAVTVDGLTHSSAQALRVRAQAEGHTLRAKVWASADGEPFGWQVSAHTETITEPGWVGIRSGVASGNTNTSPVVFSYDDFEVTLRRITAEVSSWPQRWDVSGNDVYTLIEAAGIGRRLGQGASALQSALRRGILSDAIATPVAYWPCEEAPRASLIASGLPGGNVMHVATGTPEFGANTDFDCSDALPLPKNSFWKGNVPAHSLNDRAQVRFLLSVPDAGISEQSLVAIGTSGSLATWLVIVSAAGALKLRVFNRSGTLVHDSGFFAYAVNGDPVYMSVEFEQVGSAVEANLVTLRPGAATGSQLPFTSISSQTVGIPTYVQVGSVGDVAFGHISVHNVWSSLFDLGDQLNAWRGETAGRRAERLCAEEGISFSHIGDLDETAAMGSQKSAAVIDLLHQCAEADLGTLYEPRGDLGYCYRTRASLYNQAATLALDYSAGQVSPPFEPTDDDQLTRNDVEAKRTDGSSARVVQETGPLSVQPPPEGIGRYDDSAEVNVATDEQLPDVAGWLLSLGTVDEARYPSVRVDLTTSGVVDAGIEGQVLDMDVDDRLTISDLPAGQPPGTVSQLARGYTESINVYEHSVTFNCSPESPYQVLELDDTDARLDSDTSTLDAGIDDDDTSLSVAIADGTLWTTDSGQMPFSITIGGEEMTVTAISGASSPQTFTVTRSVNAVEKSHESGAEVHVTCPARLAL